MQDKIHSLLKKKDLLLQVELNFVIHVQNKQLFSPPEEKTINNLYHKYCENGWLRSYDKRKRRIMKSCAEFWVNNPPRFSELAAQVLNDPDFVPTKEQYREMCEDKEARNFLHPEEAKPLYPAGSLVKIKRISSLPGAWGKDFQGKLGVVIRVRRNEQIYPSNDSNFLYHILPQGMAELMMFPEKDLKLAEVSK